MTLFCRICYIPVTLIQLKGVLYDNSYTIIKLVSYVYYSITVHLNAETKLEKAGGKHSQFRKLKENVEGSRKEMKEIVSFLCLSLSRNILVCFPGLFGD